MLSEPFDADLLVVGELEAPAGFAGALFADGVGQRRERQREGRVRRQGAQGGDRPIPHRLVPGEDLGRPGQDRRKQAAGTQLFDRDRAGGMFEHLAEFLGNSLGAHHGDLPGHLVDGGGGGRFDGKAEAGRHPHRPHEPEFVLAKALARVADGPEDFRPQVVLTADKIQHPAGDRVEEHAVDGEIAALRVLLGAGVGDAVGAPAVEIGAVGAKGGHLNLVMGFVRQARADHLDDAETRPDLDRAAKEFHHLFRPGVAGDVVVGRGQPQQFVAHASAGPIGHVPGIGQPANHIQGKLPFGHEISVKARRPLSFLAKPAVGR